MFYFLLQDCILHARDENALLHIPLTIQYNKSIDNRLLYYPCKDSLFQKRTCIEMFQELALLAALCRSVDRFSCCCPTRQWYEVDRKYNSSSQPLGPSSSEWMFLWFQYRDWILCCTRALQIAVKNIGWRRLNVVWFPQWLHESNRGTDQGIINHVIWVVYNMSGASDNQTKEVCFKYA